MLKYNVRGENIEVTDALRSYVEKRLNKLEKYLKILIEEDREELDRIAEGDKILERVVEEIKEMSKSPLFIGVYDIEEENERIRNSDREEAKKEKEEGILKSKIEIAKNLLKKKMSVDEISEITNLTIEEINSLNY